jgi:hypothetical protein
MGQNAVARGAARVAKQHEVQRAWGNLRSQTGLLRSELYEFVDKPGNDSLCATLKSWRDAFGQRGELCNSHCVSSLDQAGPDLLRAVLTKLS